MPTGGTDTRSVLDRVFRDEAGRLVASLVRLLGDFDLAEEVVSEAVVQALESWPATGVPDRPGAWLLATARHRALDRVRRDANYARKLAALAALPADLQREPDDRIRLLFTCCHPALDAKASVALSLRAVGGLTTAEIARAFLVPEATLARRLSRAKRKITAAGIPYRSPEPEEMADRLDRVLSVVYLVFNEGFMSTAEVTTRRELAGDAEWLAGLVCAALPDEPEPLGLLALIRLHLARWATRVDDRGLPVPLDEQDRSRWDRRMVSQAIGLLERAAAARRVGVFQLEAAIAAVHCEATTWADTDWPQLLGLYDMLLALDATAVVRLNRAVVVGHLHGAEAALSELEGLGGELGKYHLFHATQAEFLRRAGRRADADAADRRALSMTCNPGERLLLEARLAASR